MQVEAIPDNFSSDRKGIESEKTKNQKGGALRDTDSQFGN